MHVGCHLCQFSLQWIRSYAIGSFLSQHKQPHLLYERIEQSMGIHVVKCVTYKNAAGARVYIITILLGLQWNI